MDAYVKNNRIVDALSLRGLKKIELAEMTGIHKATISNWINQKYQPKQKSLNLMAQVLDVSELWLAGYNVDMERPLAQKEKDELTKLATVISSNPKYLTILRIITSLDDSQLATVELMLKGLSN